MQLRTERDIYDSSRKMAVANIIRRIEADVAIKHERLKEFEKVSNWRVVGKIKCSIDRRLNALKELRKLPKDSKLSITFEVKNKYKLHI